MMGDEGLGRNFGRMNRKSNVLTPLFLSLLMLAYRDSCSPMIVCSRLNYGKIGPAMALLAQISYHRTRVIVRFWSSGRTCPSWRFK